MGAEAGHRLVNATTLWQHVGNLSGSAAVAWIVEQLLGNFRLGEFPRSFSASSGVLALHEEIAAMQIDIASLDTGGGRDEAPFDDAPEPALEESAFLMFVPLDGAGLRRSGPRVHSASGCAPAGAKSKTHRRQGGCGALRQAGRAATPARRRSGRRRAREGCGGGWGWDPEAGEARPRRPTPNPSGIFRERMREKER